MYHIYITVRRHSPKYLFNVFLEVFLWLCHHFQPLRCLPATPAHPVWPTDLPSTISVRAMSTNSLFLPHKVMYHIYITVRRHSPKYLQNLMSFVKCTCVLWLCHHFQPLRCLPATPAHPVTYRSALNCSILTWFQQFEELLDTANIMHNHKVP